MVQESLETADRSGTDSAAPTPGLGKRSGLPAGGVPAGPGRCSGLTLTVELVEDLPLALVDVELAYNWWSPTWSTTPSSSPRRAGRSPCGRGAGRDGEVPASARKTTPLVSGGWQVVIVQVLDSGVGIPARDLPRVFSSASTRLTGRGQRRHWAGPFHRPPSGGEPRRLYLGGERGGVGQHLLLQPARGGDGFSQPAECVIIWGMNATMELSRVRQGWSEIDAVGDRDPATADHGSRD